MDEYKNVNIRPKYVKDRQIINFERFNQIVPDSCIIRELQHVLVDSFTHPHINYQNVFIPSGSNSESVNSQYVELKEKKKYYNYDSIFDKDLIKLKQEWFILSFIQVNIQSLFQLLMIGSFMRQFKLNL